MIKIAVIGYGYWGPNLVRNFNELEEVELVGICDKRPERFRIAKTRYPYVRTVNCYKKLFEDFDIDAIVIATPVATHYQMVKEALEVGKHVLVEKPLTSTSEEAQELIKLATKNQKVLMVDHTFVYTGAVRKMNILNELWKNF